MRNFGALLAFLLLSACATGYHSARNPLLGIFGGFTDSDGYGTLTKVNFYGNGHISIDKVTEYTLRRCAELAQEKNKPYFAIYSAIYDAYFDKPAKQPNYFVIGGKPNGYTYVSFLDSEIPGSFSTAETLKKLRSVDEEVKK